MWASQHIEQCAIRNSILMEGVESFVTLRRDRFMCAVKPFEVNCILLSFCACNILCSSSYGDVGGCSPSHSLIFSSSFVPLCVQYHCVNTPFPPVCLWTQQQHTCLPVRAHYIWMHQFRDRGGIINEVLKCGGRLVAVEGPWLPPPLEAMISVSGVGLGGGDWKDSKTSHLGDLMQRIPDDCNVPQLSFTVSLPLQISVYRHTPRLLFSVLKASIWWFTGQKTCWLKLETGPSSAAPRTLRSRPL